MLEGEQVGGAAMAGAEVSSTVRRGAARGGHMEDQRGHVDWVFLVADHCHVGNRLLHDRFLTSRSCTDGLTYILTIF